MCYIPTVEYYSSIKWNTNDFMVLTNPEDMKAKRQTHRGGIFIYLFWYE